MQSNHQDTIPTEILTEPLKNPSVETKETNWLNFLAKSSKETMSSFSICLHSQLFLWAQLSPTNVNK